MFIQSNIEAMQSYLSLTRIDAQFNKSLAKISSGMELPKPQFGGGMYAVANDMEAIYREYIQGAANVQDAQGFLEVAQMTMMEVNDLIMEMNELAGRAATDTINTDQRQELDTEFQQLVTDISTAHIHHILPTKYGGTEKLNNLWLLHQDCYKSLHSEYSLEQMRDAVRSNRSYLPPAAEGESCMR